MAIGFKHMERDWFADDDGRGVPAYFRRAHRRPANGPVSFMLRYGDSLFKVNTVAEHAALDRKYGYVWLGKFGVGASQARIDQLKAQLTKKQPSTLYLCNHKAITHEARILDVVGGGVRNLRVAPEPSRVPKYYRDIGCAIWFKVSRIRKARPESLRVLRLANDPTSIPRLNTTQSLIMVVRARKRDRI
jgi:hypothetical protein